MMKRVITTKTRGEITGVRIGDAARVTGLGSTQLITK